MDLFMEYMVEHKRSPKEMLIIAGAVAASVLVLVLASPLLFAYNLAGLYFLIIVAAVYGICLVVKKTSVEFEYILTNNELDIDKITSKTSRKRVVTVNFASIDICACTTDRTCKREYENTQAITKTFDCTGDGQTGIYFIDFSGENGKTRILFQPPVKLLENARKFNHEKIIIS